jgi:hypothetical protein
MRVAVGTACGNNKIIDSGIPMGAILHYDEADDSEPDSTGVTMRTGCDDETTLVPFVPNTVPSTIVAQDELALNHVQDASTDNLFRWTIDGTPQIVNWNQPSLKIALDNGQDYGNNSNIHEIKTKDDVSICQLLSLITCYYDHVLLRSRANISYSGICGTFKHELLSPCLILFISTATISTSSVKVLVSGMVPPLV